jgi:peptidoglycan/xylan/chitin deacetylase (PgdA/CDA1 family)
MKLTILMYHKIAEPAPNVRYPGNYVSPGDFEQQMDALLRWGYASIRFEEWFDYRAGQTSSLPAKPLIVTFDDGYTCFDRHAWPILRARRIGATMFLVAGQIGGTNAWDREETPEQLLDATRIRELGGFRVTYADSPSSRAYPADARVRRARSIARVPG